MLKGKTVNCSLPSCSKQIYRMPSRIKKYNFCCHEHRIIFQRSLDNKDFGKGWKHTPEEIEKIRQANLTRNYNVCFTQKTRNKLAKSAKNKIWTDEARKNASLAHVGKRLSQEQIQKIKEHAKYGWKNNQWKGRFASIVARHLWIRRHYKGPWVCWHKDSGMGKCAGRLEFSNRDHEYRKRMKEWLLLCKFHHDKYDFEHGLRHLTEKTEKIYQKFGNTKLKDFNIDGVIINKTISIGLNYL